MATRTVTAALVAATLTLTACVSPYEDAIKADLAACTAGNGAACTDAHYLQTQDQIWHAEKNREVGNALLGILAVGVAAAGVAAAARAPAPPPPPVFVPRPIFVPPPPLILP